MERDDGGIVGATQRWLFAKFDADRMKISPPSTNEVKFHI
jgi:hypothetical protein